MNATLRTLAASAAFAAATAAIPATATEWFVATNGLDSADGLSEASAFLTIQHAVDAADEGDVVTVLPGIYGSGKTTVNCDGLQCHQRVFISKDLTLRSRDGASVTHIVGDWDASSATGMGDAAVRCIGVTNAATAVRIQGFTIRDGASRYASNGGDKATNRAGGVLQILNNPTPDQCSHVVVEDCVLSGNVGTRGGAIYGVTAVRCRIVGNRASNFGAAARQCRLYNCLVARNAPTTTPFSSNTDKVGAIAYGYDAVNCTVAYNESDAFRNCDYNATSFKTTTEAEKILNCVVVGNRGYVASASMSKLFNSVVEVAMPSNNCFSVNIGGAFSPLFAAPAAGDYRLIGGKPAVTSSPATSNFGGRPAEYVSTDIDGTPHGASPLCGCFAGAAGSDGDGWVEIVQAAGGTVFVDGIPATATKTNYVTAAVWPRTYDISFEPKDGKGLVCWLYATAPGATPGPRYGLSDGTMRFLPSRTAAHTTLSPLTGDAVWVSPDGSDITGDGSEANPWRTLQKGVSESGRLVLAKPGVYAEGGAVASGLMARVALTNASVRVLAVSGPEATSIVGADAAQTPAAANDLGLGPDAVRCIYLGAERTAVQGFTVAGGRTSIAANDADDSSAQLVRGGGMLSAPGYYRSNSTALLDCVVTNNAASRGAAVFGGSCERCLFADNAFTSAGNGVTRETALWACVMTRQGSAKPPFGQNTVGYNCTIAGNSAPNGGMVFQTVGLTTLRNSLLASNDGGPDIAFTNLHWCVYEDASAATIDLIANYNDLRTATRFADVAGGDFRPYSTSAAATFGSPGYWAGRNMADFAGEAFRVFDAGTSARIAAGALGGASGIVPAVVIATNRLRGGVEPLGEVAIAGETLTVAATRGYRINTVEIGGRTVEVNGRAFTVTAAEALECAPLQMMVNLYPSPFVIIIR
jgi:hypothetical protein